MTKKGSKLIFFDLDGTLVDGYEYIWQYLYGYFGVEKMKADQLKGDYTQKKIEYGEWVLGCIGILVEAGMDKSRLESALCRLQPTKGAHETLDKLRQRGYKIYVVSGGVDTVIKAVLGSDIMFDGVAINKLVFSNSGEICNVTPTKYDMENKAKYIQKTAKENGTSASRCIFVGDNLNDIDAAAAAGVSIAFNCKSPELSRASTHNVESRDLRDILRYTP